VQRQKPQTQLLITCTCLNTLFKILNKTTYSKTNPTLMHSHLRLTRDFSSIRSTGFISCGDLRCGHHGFRNLRLTTIHSCSSSRSPWRRCLPLCTTYGNVNILGAPIALGILIGLRLVKNKSLDGDINLSTKNNVPELTRFSSSIFCIQYGIPFWVHQCVTSLLAILLRSLGKS
jgi:hypothetical protein